MKIILALIYTICLFMLFAVFQPVLDAVGIKTRINKPTDNTVQAVTSQTATPAVTLTPKVILLEQALTDYELVYGRPDTLLASMDADMIYKNDFTELPLDPTDYYLRKYENAVAGVNGINKMPVVTPGQSLAVIRGGYISIKAENGFVRAPKHYFGSGVCWSTSTLGAILDNANASFKKKYGVDLVVYQSGDRGPHSGKYKTYTNNGFGYTIMEVADGVPSQDYKFTINPTIKDIPALAGIKIKVVMMNTDKHKSGAHGESIAGYVLSNIEF